MKTIVDLETDLVKPYIDAEDEKFAANIAPVETSPTTGAHAVGSQIIYNGVLYDVTAAIAATDALVVGTNIAAADDVVTELSSLKNALSDYETNFGRHNFFDIEDFLTNGGARYERTGNTAYTITTQGTLYSSPYELINPSMAFIASGSISSNNLTRPRLEFLNAAGTVVATLEGTSSSVSVTGAIRVRLNYNGSYEFGDTITLSDVMIRLSTDGNSTYQPYTPNNNQLLSYKDNGVLGAKNLLPLGLATIKSLNTGGTWSGNAYSQNGITYTVETNSDGSIADIKVNGTSSAANNDLILYSGNLTNFAGKLLTGNPGAAKTTIRAELIGPPYTNYGNDFGNGVIINDGIGTGCKIFIRVDPSTTVSNQIFKPMIRLANDTDPTYQPYAQTNQELSIRDSDFVTPETGALDITSKRVGNVVNITISGNITADGTQTLGTLTKNVPSNWVMNAMVNTANSVDSAVLVGIHPNLSTITVYRAKAGGINGSLTYLLD